MAKKVIEYDVCDITQETVETLDIISTAMHCIEQNFYNMEFTVQKYEDGIIQSEDIYKPINSVLNEVVVDLDSANDEFILKLEKPITVQVFDGIARQLDYLQVEVVTEGTAEDNDRDFLRGEVENYKLGEVNSYYKPLGTLDGYIFYYREL